MTERAYGGPEFDALWWALHEDSAKLITVLYAMDVAALEGLLDAVQFIDEEAQDCLDRRIA